MRSAPPIATVAGLQARAETADPATKALVLAALDMIGQTEARAKRRAFLQRGWARALLHEASEDLEAMAISLRAGAAAVASGRHESGRFGIAVCEAEGDVWAAQYQRVAFRRKRVRRALGQDGLVGRAVWDNGGFRQIEQAVIDDENTNSMQELRRRAQRAKARIGDEVPVREAIVAAMHDMSAEEDMRFAWGGY